jgi:hypothetical protein
MGATHKRCSDVGEKQEEISKKPMKQRVDVPRKSVRSLRELPVFSSEDEERDWWAAHDLSEELYDQLQPAQLKSATDLKRAIEIEVVGPPPVYGAALSLDSPRHPHAVRVADLRKKAREVMRGRPAITTPVVLAVSQTYVPGAMADAPNVIGAISNALEGIVYAKDALIREIHFQSKKGRRSAYTIRIVPVPTAA